MKAGIKLPVEAAYEHRESLRRIALRGMCNLRDLGGYATDDGRIVKWGVLYRSDAVRPGNPDSLAALVRMRLVTIIDFRSAEERGRIPDLLPENQTIRLVSIPVFDGPTSIENVVKEHLRAGTAGTIDTKSLFIEAYEQLPRDFLPQFKAFVREVMDAGGKPVLFHCAAGKDRTGFASALLLRMLDVPASTVLEDYMLSNRYMMKFKFSIRLMFRIRYGAKAYRVMKSLAPITPEFMEAAFGNIDALYGSFDNFVRQGLCLGESDIVRLKDMLLEPAPIRGPTHGPGQA